MAAKKKSKRSTEHSEGFLKAYAEKSFAMMTEALGVTSALLKKNEKLAKSNARMSKRIREELFIEVEQNLRVDIQYHLYRRMKSLGVTEEELAARLGVSKRSVHHTLSASNMNIRIHTLARYYGVLGDECRVGSRDAGPWQEQARKLGRRKKP